MLNINLLPWREMAQERKHKKNAVIILLVFLILSSLCINTHCLLNKKAAQHKQKMTTLKNQLTQRATAVKRYTTSLQAATAPPSSMTEKSINLLFTQFLKNDPKNVCFHGLEITNTDNQPFAVFSGTASSLNELTEFFKNWQMASLFSDININTITKMDDHIEFSFTGHLIATSM